MRKILLLLAFAMSALQANAAHFQSVVEAEPVSTGTLVSDLDASAGAAVTRSTTGGYTWWLSDTSSFSTGSYTLYARLKLLPGTASPAPFGAQIFYGSTQIAAQTALVTSREYHWVRITSFDLAQIGGQLRISDWSGPGMNVDKLALVKDTVIEAEFASGGTIVADSAASGGRAVNRTSSGVYVWWTPTTTDLVPGDYDVYVRLRSVDGLTHNYSSYVTLDTVTASPGYSFLVSSTAYQWVKFNPFTYAGGTQSVRISDYSTLGLNVDKVRLVRRTPYERTSAAETLFAKGNAALGARELVTFNGIPTGKTELWNPARVSVVQASPTTTYIYFRQALTTEKGAPHQIYMATSTDGGTTFNILPNPIIPFGPVSGLGSVENAYDPQVTKRPDGYYMVFEAKGLGGNNCPGFSAASAYSQDGINNWQVKSVTICDKIDPDGSVSTPGVFINPNTGTQYLQWASVNKNSAFTGHYQAPLQNGILQNNYTFTDPNQIAQYALKVAETTAWDGKNYGAGNVYYENDNYYLVYEGADSYTCENTISNWGIGISRTSTPETVLSWTRSPKNPLLTEYQGANCWMGYPQLVSLPQGVYLYYFDGFINFVELGKGNKTIFRQKVLTN